MGYSRKKELIQPPPFSTINSQLLVPKQSEGSYHDHYQKSGPGEFHDHQQNMIMGTSRWNPAPEQLLELEELYRRGTRTPTTEQIQHIASKLCRFGKIEGKNVFYWFQNHKARERQKRRREGETNHEQQCVNDVTECSEKRESGLRRTGNEVEQAKNWASSSTCSKLRQESTLVNTGIESGRGSEDHGHATWQTPKMIRTSSQNPPIPSNIPQYCFITSPLPKPKQENLNNINLLEEETREIQTLDLFPVHKNDGENKAANDSIAKGETNLAYALMITPNQYYEFIPLKN